MDYPTYVKPESYGYGASFLQGGSQTLNDILSRRYQGLPDYIKNAAIQRSQKAISGNINAGVNAINENFDPSMSQESRVAGIAKIFGGANEANANVMTDVAFKDYEAQNQNFQNSINNYLGLTNAATAQGSAQNSDAIRRAGMQNEFNLGAYQADEANSFKWGDVLGTALQAGGAAAGMCCFIFMEAYGYELPWYVRFCRDFYYEREPGVARGYKKSAKWIVPLMRKYATVRNLVWKFMVEPISEHGKWLCGEGMRSKKNEVVKNIWFKFWKYIGGR